MCSTRAKKFEPFDNFFPKVFEAFLDFGDVDILSPGLLAFPRWLLQLSWWIKHCRHDFEGSILVLVGYR